MSAQFLGGRFDFDLLFIAPNSEKKIFAIAATVSGNRRKLYRHSGEESLVTSALATDRDMRILARSGMERFPK